jgi:hypothetical protein
VISLDATEIACSRAVQFLTSDFLSERFILKNISMIGDTLGL